MRGIGQVSHHDWMERSFLSAWQTDEPMSRDSKADPVTERLIACIEDEEFAAGYPSRTHFISADHPDQGGMAVSGLGEGDPVALVYRDGYELLIRPGGGKLARPA